MIRRYCTKSKWSVYYIQLRWQTGQSSRLHCIISESWSSKKVLRSVLNWSLFLVFFKSLLEKLFQVVGRVIKGCLKVNESLACWMWRLASLRSARGWERWSWLSLSCTCSWSWILANRSLITWLEGHKFKNYLGKNLLMWLCIVCKFEKVTNLSNGRILDFLKSGSVWAL